MNTTQQRLSEVPGDTVELVAVSTGVQEEAHASGQVDLD